MITFLDLGLYGRLGNQLYQYAALRGISEKTGIECKIPDFHDYSWHGQKCLLNNFNLKAPPLEYADRMRVRGTYEEKSPNVFYEKFFSVKPHCNIKGFFQFTGYFDHCENIIREELAPKKIFLDKAEKFLDHLVDDQIIERIYGKEDIFDETTIYGKYLNKAMSLFEDKKVKYLVFSGGNRNADDTTDIAYIKKVFNDDRFIISDTNDPMEDFSLIMSCDHNIACHQTSFGWWAAYLNDNQNKIVTAPEHYYFEMPKEESDKRVTNGTFPSDWTIIN